MAPPLKGFEIRLDRGLDHGKLVEWFDGEVSKAQDFNPHISSTVWKGRRLLNKGHMIRVPYEKQMEVVKELETYKIPKSVIVTATTHRVRRGETLSEIAERYKLSTRKLMDYNNISNARSLQAGQVLQIPSN